MYTVREKKKFRERIINLRDPISVIGTVFSIIGIVFSIYFSFNTFFGAKEIKSNVNTINDSIVYRMKNMEASLNKMQKKVDSAALELFKSHKQTWRKNE